tara:strand:+ start:2159 stop:2680 length:522 start_codon:yes stop_codon:yes gene_type:complete
VLFKMKKIQTLLLYTLVFSIMIQPQLTYAEVKMGIVNLSRLLNEVPMYKDAREKIQKKFDPRARNLKTLEKEWNTLNDKYLKNESVMSDKEKKGLITKIQGVEEKLRSGQEKLQIDLDKTQREEYSKIEKVVNEAISEYAEKNDFDIIFRAESTTLYAKKYINITQDIISKLQ